MGRRVFSAEPETLRKLVAKKDIGVTCITGKVCKEGCCNASISLEGGKYSLVTGIVPGADYLGSCSFELKDILDIGREEVVVSAHERNGDTSIMRLEPRP
jgi:hypothetical protein